VLRPANDLYLCSFLTGSFNMNISPLIVAFCLLAAPLRSQTYAEKLGFPKNAKVLILHVDDVGMSYDSNDGAIAATEKGVATSMSVMMPCPWVPGFFHYLRQHPTVDAGLHLTLTSEWQDYRWGPLAGKTTVPGLTDPEGALWPSVAEVVQHATPEEIDREIRSQLDRARTMGFTPTHLDSHMGTLFAKPEFLEKYLQLGMEQKIPVMFPGGHNAMIFKLIGSQGFSLEQTTAIGTMLWNAGLPVLDDLHNVSYGFEYPSDSTLTDAQLQKIATEQYLASFKDLQPGVTMVIMHCTHPTEVFEHISDSGTVRRGDLLAMQSPELKKYITDNGIVLTTWRELMERRKKL
jgi:chitin disaccharide deacetylase